MDLSFLPFYYEVLVRVTSDIQIAGFSEILKTCSEPDLSAIDHSLLLDRLSSLDFYIGSPPTTLLVVLSWAPLHNPHLCNLQILE